MIRVFVEDMVLNDMQTFTLDNNSQKKKVMESRKQKHRIKVLVIPTLTLFFFLKILRQLKYTIAYDKKP